VTDEERREAKRLWQLSGGESGTRLENYLAGYAAACEAKIAEIDDWQRISSVHFEAKHVERERSAKLLSVLKRARDNAGGLMEAQDNADLFVYAGHVWAVLRDAIAEYEEVT
jgi:hypothetical protein